jgi:hypothetical protein
LERSEVRGAKALGRNAQFLNQSFMSTFNVTQCLLLSDFVVEKSAQIFHPLRVYRGVLDITVIKEFRTKI